MTILTGKRRKNKLIKPAKPYDGFRSSPTLPSAGQRRSVERCATSDRGPIHKARCKSTSTKRDDLHSGNVPRAKPEEIQEGLTVQDLSDKFLTMSQRLPVRGKNCSTVFPTD
jgi:hypothetical protein